MNIDTHSLLCFLALVETKSFTKAANKLGRTQSAISQQITKLEHLLDKTLFDRDKHLALTQDGEIFFSYATRIVGLHHEMQDRFKNPDIEGQIRFGVPEDFASVFLADVLADFIHKHPRVFLNVECDLTINLFDKFKENDFDLVLIKMMKPDDFPHGIEVWSEPLEWVGNKNLLSNNNTIPLILSPTPCVYRGSALQALDNANVSWQLAFTSPSYAATIAAVRAGIGITVLPYTMIPDDLERIPRNMLPQLQDIHVSLIKHTENNAAINSFEEFVYKRLKH